MEAKLTEAGPFERVVTVLISSSDLAGAEEKAARHMSRDLKIKGFRPGKAPRRIVESMVGADRIRTQALEEALPDLVGKAIEEMELNPAVPPNVKATRETDEGLEVDVVVTLWPELDSPPDYADRRIVVGSVDVTGDEIDEQVERLRDQYAELEEVTRAADDGDFVMIDLSGTRDGVAVPVVTTTDLLYEIGSGTIVPGIDEPLTGSQAGDVLAVETELPTFRFGEEHAGPIDLKILVKGVRAKKLPEVTAEWVSDVTEFETVEELRDHLAERLAGFKRTEIQNEFRGRLLDDLVADTDIELPEGLVMAEMDASAHRFVHRLESQGLSLETYLEITQQDEEQFIADLRAQAVRSITTRVLLDAVVDSEGLEVEADEVTEAIEQMATAAKQPVDEFRQQLVGAGQVPTLVGDMLRQKALDRMVERAAAVDADGNEVAFEAAAGADDGDIEEDELQPADETAPPSGDSAEVIE